MNPLAATTSDWLCVATLLADAAFELDLEASFQRFRVRHYVRPCSRSLLETPAVALMSPVGDAAAEILATVRDEMVVWHGQVSVIHLDGTPRHCRLALAPKLNMKGKVVGIYGLLIDLTAPELDTPPSAESNGTQQDRSLDSETGLWNALSFIEQAARRFDRLDVESQPGTLLFLGFGRAQPKMQTPTAMRLADELREIVRPTDLLGRIDRTTIALWCDGMDHLTGAERAARFCKHLPVSLPDQPLISVGLVTRWPGSTDDPATIIQRANLALKEAYAATARDANGSWRVWQTAMQG